MPFVYKITVLLILLGNCLGTASAQTTYYSRANGSWNDPNTWSTLNHLGISDGTVPGSATDMVIIAAGHTIEYNANHPVNSITIGTLTLGTADGAGVLRFPFSDYDASGETDDLNDTFSLTVSGNVIINSNGQIINEEGGAGIPALSGSPLDRTHALIIQGNLTNSGTLDLEGTTSSRIIDLQFTGAGNQTISGEGSYDTYNITYNNIGSTPNDQIINKSVNFTASVIEDRSIFVRGTYVHDNTGTYTNQGSVSAGNSYTDVSFEIRNGVFTMVNTVSVDKTVDLTNGNLTISGGRFNSGSGGTGTGNVVNMAIGGILTVSSTGVLNIGDGDPSTTTLPTDGALTVSGNGSTLNSATIYAHDLTIEADASLAVSNGANLSVGGTTSGRLSLNSTTTTDGATFNMDGGTCNITEALSLSSGTIATVNSGILNIGTSVATNCIIFPDDPTAATRFVFNNGTANLGNGGSLLLIGDGDALPAFGNTGYQSLEINGGSFNLNGGFQLNDANARFIMSSGTLNLNPQGNQNLAGTLNVFFLDRGIVNVSGGDIYIINPNANTGSGYALNINPLGDPGTTDNRISGSSASPDSPVNFNGNFRFGDGSSTLTGSTDGFDVYIDAGHIYKTFYINNPGGVNRHVELVTSNQSYTVSGNLYILAGIFDINTNKINRQTSGGILVISATGHLIIGNNNNANHFPGNTKSFSIYSINQISTVEYDGMGDALVNIPGPGQFGNLIISGTGTKTLSTPKTVGNVLTLESSVFVTTTRLTMNSGSSIIRTATDTEGIMTGTVQGANNYTVAYSGSSKTTQAAEWSGTGSKTFAISLTAGETLTTHNALTVGGDLNLNSGILADAGYTITANSNVINSGVHTGSGKILLTGSATAHNIGGSGTGQFQNIELNDVNGAIFSAAQNINGTLTLTEGILNIDTYLLSLGASASVSATSPGIAKMIQIEGSASAAGMQKTFTGTGNFTWPIGTNGKYTPATIDIISTGSGGNITLNPVDIEHPSTADASNLALDYYWQVTTSGFSLLNATHTYTYDQGDQTGRGNEVAYVPARYEAGLWTALEDVSQVDENSNTITLSNVNYIEGEYTAAEPSEFGVVYTYYSRANGDWNAPTSWSTVAVGGAPATTIPGSSTPVTVGSGNQITMSANNLSTPTMDIQANGVVEIADNTTGLYFGTVTGSGTIRIITNDAVPTAFPGGTFTDFMSAIGGTVEYNGSGTYTVLSTPVAYHHLMVSGSGVLTLPDADLNMSGDFTISGNTTVLTSAAAMGALDITGNLNISSITASLLFQAGTVRNIVVGGDVNNEGTIQVSGSGTVVHNMTIGGTLTNNNILELVEATSSHRCDIRFNGSAAQTINGTGNFGSIEVDGAGLTLTGDISIGANLTLTNGTFSAGTNTVSFTGNMAQQLAGTFTFYNLTKSAGGSLTLNDNISITNTLTLTDGIIYTSDAAQPTLPDGATVVGGSNSSYIQGPMVHTATINGGPVTKIFPFGSENRYRGVSLDLNPTSVSGGTVTYTGTLKKGSPPSRTLPDSLDHISSVQYYTISQSGGGVGFNPNAVVSILYNDDDGVDTPSDLRIAKSDGAGGWLDIGGTGTAPLSGQITSDIFNSFSDFVLASSSANNPLPVDLLYFGVEAIPEGGVKVSWQTASEQNNDYFSIERSVNGKTFMEIATVKGAGNSTSLLAYSAIDHHPVQGKNYYRLKQVDFDGAWSYSKTVPVNYQQPTSLFVIIKPNPITSGEAEILLQGLGKSELAEVALYTRQGVRLQAHQVRADLGGQATARLTDVHALPKGIYILSVYSKNGYQTKKLILK